MENPPPNHQVPDQDQLRNNGNVVGDSTSMTIEFLRARLLAERSVSRTAKQRADELAKRVAELEEQLKVVSLQRKKAEKATADVLAILENRGERDFSEEFDSSSDQESNHFKTKMGRNVQEEESSVGSKMERNRTDDFSGSEIETSSLTGRSLSWKSGKDSPSSGGNFLVISSSKKRSPFSSPSFASSRRSAGGKSCRRIRQSETRSAAEEHTNRSTQAPQENGDADWAEGCPTSPRSSTQIPGNGSENRDLNIVVKGSGDLESRQPEALLSNHLHNRDGEIKRALEDQAQLIGQYEEEERAQREWEDKFRENNSSPVSCEHGTTRSDITEEIDETKADSAPYPVCNNVSTDFEIKSNVKHVSIVEQLSSISKLSGLQPSPPPPIYLSKVDSRLGSKNENDSMPHEEPDKLGSVLEALQQAKLSLNHKLKASPPLNDGTIRKAIEFSPKDRPEVPGGCGGIFKVPSDFYIENTTQNNTLLASKPKLSLANYYPIEQTAQNSESTWPRFPSHPNNFTYNGLNINGGFRARLDADVPFPSPYVYNSRSMEMNNVGSSYVSPTYPLNNDPLLRIPYGGERPSSSTNMNHVRSSYASLTYPLYTDPMVRMPSDGKQVLSSTGTGVGRGDISFYNHLRPNMYR